MKSIIINWKKQKSEKEILEQNFDISIKINKDHSAIVTGAANNIIKFLSSTEPVEEVLKKYPSLRKEIL